MRRATIALTALTLWAGCDDEPAPTESEATASMVEVAENDPGAEATPEGAPPVEEAAAPVPEPGECELSLSPDRRFRPRFRSYEANVDISNHLPALSADGQRIALDNGMPGMAEGDEEPPPVEFAIVSAADGELVETVLLATGDEQNNVGAIEVVEQRVRAARRKIEEGDFRSFRRIRGPVRGSDINEVLARFDELEGPCREALGLPPGVDPTIPSAPILPTLPQEDDRCGNMVHDVYIHALPEHGLVLIGLNVGTHADLCASGVGWFAIRYAATD